MLETGPRREPHPCCPSQVIQARESHHQQGALASRSSVCDTHGPKHSTRGIWMLHFFFMRTTLWYCRPTELRCEELRRFATCSNPCSTLAIRRVNSSEVRLNTPETWRSKSATTRY